MPAAGVNVDDSVARRVLDGRWHVVSHLSSNVSRRRRLLLLLLPRVLVSTYTGDTRLPAGLIYWQ